MATLKDVAKRAGVSAATVSCCLSGAKNVKAETKLRIMQAVEELNYIPNAAARELRMTKTNKIGVVFPNIDDSYYNGLLRGISEQLRSNSHILNVAFSYQNAKFECEKIDELIHANVTGLLILTCQPENSEYFTSRVTKYNVPTVFLHHRPAGMDVNFLGFDNYATMKHLAGQLLEKGYQDIAIIMGDKRFSAEADCFRGVRDAFADRGLFFPERRVYVANMTKENAFRATMLACRDRVPHAIVSTSAQMTLGIQEALNLQGIRVPEDTVVATLGVESWNKTSQLPDIIYSRRSADTLGAAAARMLLDIIADDSRKTKTVTYTDEVIYSPIGLKPRMSKPEALSPAKRTLRILAQDTPSIRALEMLSANYVKDRDITVEFTYAQIGSMLQDIVANAAEPEATYDLVFFDTPWTEYIAAHNWLDDLNEIMPDQAPDAAPQIFPRFLDNATGNGKQIGLPVLGGTQIMFYRKDLFEKPAIMQAYKEQTGATLRPPKTWQEYNRIAAFFTRACNPDSPTAYGTAFPGIWDEFLAPEVMIRLWANGGSLVSSSGKPKIATAQNHQAYKIMLDSLRFMPENPFDMDAEAVTALFCAGEVAMIIAFTEFAGKILDSLNQQLITEIGYAPIPGCIDMRAGWNLGISKNSAKKDLIFPYFKWLFEADTGCYYTILGGQATIRQPYDNSEIIGLYPWMELTKRPSAHLYNRGIPTRKGRRVIPVNQVEEILCNVLRRAACSEISLSGALQTAQEEMEQLFIKYGYQ